MPLKSAKLPSPWRKKRSIGIIRSMALSSAGGGTRLRAVNALRRGRRSSNNSMSAPGLRLIWPPSGRICRVNSSESRLLAARIWRCWRGIAQRNCSLQSRRAVARLRGRATQMADLPRQAAQKSAIELGLGAVEQKRRLAEPRHNPPCDHIRTPSHRIVGTADRDPLIDECARIGATDARFGGAKVAQPAEAEKRSRPFLGRRGDFEGRAGIAADDLARKREPPCVNFACPSGISGPQVLRRDDDTVGLGEGKRPVDDRMRGDAPGPRTILSLPRPKRATSRC